MFLPLPTLDDTRWSDLVEQSRALIPVYAPEWTDHNVSDPGITLIDLLAWLAEMQVFQLDQVPPSAHPARSSGLSACRPSRPARPGRCSPSPCPTARRPPQLAAGLACEGSAPDGRTVGFRTLHDIQALPGRVTTLTADRPFGPARPDRSLAARRAGGALRRRPGARRCPRDRVQRAAAGGRLGDPGRRDLRQAATRPRPRATTTPRSCGRRAPGRRTGRRWRWARTARER